MTAVGDAFGRAASLHYLALVLERTGDLSGAMRRFEEAKNVFIERNSHAWAMDPLAGVARCALALGQLDEARRHVTELWNYMSDHGPKGMEQPVWAYLTCADISDALGEREQAHAAIKAGYRELMDRAGKISDPEWRKSFLENVPEHRAIIELWERNAPPVA